MQHLNMEKFANGAFTAQINRELEKVTQNIQDPNTDATAKRKRSEEHTSELQSPR